MIINNVKLVLDNEVVDGSIEIQDGTIRAFAETQSRSPEAMDGDGGWLLPGLIELHTDNLDKFFTPRPKVDWPAHSAMSSHDAHFKPPFVTHIHARMDLLHMRFLYKYSTMNADLPHYIQLLYRTCLSRSEWSALWQSALVFVWTKL